MKLTPYLSGHLYITEKGKGIHLSPQQLKELHQFMHREKLIGNYKEEPE